MKKRVIALVLVVAVCGCAGMRPQPLYRSGESSREAHLPRVSRDDLLSEVSIYHGARYREGGTSMVGVDCSGLIQAVFGSLGVRLPRTVTEQFGHGVPVSRKDVRTGDLVFFGKTGLPAHVGIAISNTEMIHASSSKGVLVEDIDSFSRAMRLVGIRRIIRLM
jgi:cell wall-associated NlpC family hydrolase